MAENASSNDLRATQMRQRLLLDIDELIRKPYPNIHLHAGDSLSQLCLVLSPPGWQRMHMQITGLEQFPMHPPRIMMDTNVRHPNVFRDYICATILNNAAYYTPAYTLKGIAIQLLSFFGSDKIQQDYGGEAVDLESYRTGYQDCYDIPFAECERCGFEEKALKGDELEVRYRDESGTRQRRQRDAIEVVTSNNFWAPIGSAPGSEKVPVQAIDRQEATDGPFAINELPNELLLQVLESLEDFEDLTNLAKAWPRVSALITEHNVIRQRELQCFVTKKTYRDVKLGVGVSTTNGLASEFDLLSQEAFALPTRKSVQNIPFTRWLPLPISPRHWHSVRNNAKTSLSVLKEHVKLQNPTNAQTLYAFMTDIVVKLNLVNLDNDKENKKKQHEPKYYYENPDRNCSTLEHASEKAIESYFHLFHLLVCLATENPEIVTQANALLTSFLGGQRDKSHCPNLGHLLVALLVSDVPVTDELRRAIITEAITRNVVWILNPNSDSRGRRYPNNRDNTKKTYPELAYLEPDAVSAYRLDKTFQGSRTSYRLLMFSELFRRTARPSNSSSSSPSLAQIRDDLFRRHGAPPPGAAAHLASEVRRLHSINNFPAFLREMGMSENQIPTPSHFTSVLRNTVVASMDRGYSRWALAQSDALALRLHKGVDPGVGVKPEFAEMVAEAPYLPRIELSKVSFFPGNNGNVGRRGRGGNSSHYTVIGGGRGSFPPQGVAWPRRGAETASGSSSARAEGGDAQWTSVGSGHGRGSNSGGDSPGGMRRGGRGASRGRGRRY
ncbi:hypothetical protein PG993_011989 [Apiospora rasikravindrae]|uniref:F-box domain-containing protein n=1 Tax=Apiospora rasikravindrae TaxID=990691 RepID=A0ABR1S1A2_9PEZI